MDVIDAVRRRRSIEAFEPDGLLLRRGDIENLIAESCLSPSELCLQPWRFIVVRDKERKEVLFDCAGGQEKVRSAVAVVIVCGDSLAYRDTKEAVDSMVSRGVLTEEGRLDFEKQVVDRYNSDRRAREMSAVRDPAFAGMTMMLLALERGIASAPIFSFSVDSVRDAFKMDDRYFPVMMVALGLPSTSERQPVRANRRDMSELVFHEVMGGRGI